MGRVVDDLGGARGRDVAAETLAQPQADEVGGVAGVVVDLVGELDRLEGDTVVGSR